MDITLIKTKRHRNIFFIPVIPIQIEELEKIPEGMEINCEIKEIPDKRQRSYEQLGLYWAGCTYISENIENIDWNTREKVDEQIKIKCRHYECYIYYENEKTGEKTLNIKTGSISFAKLKHLEACNFFTDAFEFMAEFMGMKVEDFINAVKERMRGNI